MQPYFNTEDLLALEAIKKRRIEKIKKTFFRKGLTHLKCEKLKEFYKYINFEPSDVLFELKMKCSLSIYLYLYFKSQCDFTYAVGLSEPIQFNISKVGRLAGYTRNTVKKAFWELVDAGLVIYNEYIQHELYHFATKSILILNDEIVTGIDEKTNKVIFSYLPIINK